MNAYDLAHTRELCWDLYLAEENENVRLQIHRPIRKNIVLDCTEDWEAYGVNYLGIVKFGDTYRLYYRARDREFRKNYKNRFCIAESRDGKTFTRLSLSMYGYGGSGSNNIHFTENRIIDNFSVFYDENPACPPDEKFKALSQQIDYRPDGSTDIGLLLYRSADGLHFEKAGRIDVPGAFDSYNIVFWDAAENEYKMYIRDFHTADGADMTYAPSEAVMASAYRDVRLTRSKDFVRWSRPERIVFADGDIHTQLYTGMIFRYPDSRFYLGLPTRYNNRPEHPKNFRYLSDWEGDRRKYIDAGDRFGTVLNDTGIMTSRDGLHFDKWNGAYMTPGPERPDNWVYEDCYLAYGFAETEADDGSGQPELSLYRPEGFYCPSGHPRIVRYTVRKDGFYSWYADASGGTITTRPLISGGNMLTVNFASSALGGLRIRICGENGQPLDGYDSGILFGDSLSRPVDFDRPLSALTGQTVRLRFELTDTDLYSFQFQ